MKAFDFPSRMDVVSADSIGDPAFVVDTRGVVVSCNKEAASLFGRPVSRVVGRRCYSVVRACLPSGEAACSAGCPLIQGLGILPGPPAVELVVRGRGHPAGRYAINVQHIPLNDPHGLPSGLLHILTLAGPPEGAVDPGVDTADFTAAGNYLG
jgi:PAS domain-containing protein